MDYSQTTRAALGRMASVGDLYDARSDNFCYGLSIFTKEIPKSAVTVKDSHSSDIHMTHSDSFEEKFAMMDVKGELSASVVAGLLSLEGSGRYLGDKKKTSRSLQSALLYKIGTKDEQLNIYHEELKDALSLHSIKGPSATHVVTGISWGANSVVSCSFENRGDHDMTEIEGCLSAQMKTLQVSIKKGQLDATGSSGDNGNGMQFDVRIFGDILPTNGELPTTFDGAMQLMRQLPSLVEKCNGGKGKPLTYRLMPIQILREYLEVGGMTDLTLKPLDISIGLRIVQLFDQISLAQQEVNSFHQDVTDHKYCVSKEEMAEICNAINGMAIEQSMLRTTLSALLTEVRSGKKSTIELEDLIKKFKSSVAAPATIQKKLEGWGFTKEKILFATTFEKLGAKYIGSNSSPRSEMMQNSSCKLFMLHFNKTTLLDSDENQKLLRNMKIFTDKIDKKTDGCMFYVVDCDFHPNCLPNGKSSFVNLTEAGTCISDDLLAVQSPNPVTEVVESQTTPPVPTVNDLKWVEASLEVLPNAVKGGHEPNKILYVGRVRYACQTIPGKIVCGRWNAVYCYFAWDGKEKLFSGAELLIANDDQVSWVKMSGGPIPHNAIPGGDYEGETLYIGRAHHQGTLTPGMVREGKCVIVYWGKQYSFSDYEILVRN